MSNEAPDAGENESLKEALDAGLKPDLAEGKETPRSKPRIVTIAKNDERDYEIYRQMRGDAEREAATEKARRRAEKLGIPLNTI